MVASATVYCKNHEHGVFHNDVERGPSCPP
jgi:hypothetical protein